MFNLLPEQEKKLLRKEYRRRRLIIFLTACTMLALYALVLCVPLYLSSYVKRRSVSLEHDSVTQAYATKLAVPVGEIGRAQKLLALVSSGQTASPSSSIIRAVTESRSTGVTLSTITLTKNDAPRLQVQGMASTREALRSFSKALEATGLFQSVQVPVSSLTSNSNIPFSLDMALLQKK